ncbi:MAG: hypothetical protein ACRC92_23955 [Peptostreptococcaceae bacterium]
MSKLFKVFKDANEVMIDALFELGNSHDVSDKMGEVITEVAKFIGRIELPKRLEDKNDYRKVPILDLLDMGVPRDYIEENYSYLYHTVNEDDMINYVYATVPEENQPTVISSIVSNRDEIRESIEYKMSKDTPIHFENELFSEALTSICGYVEEE